MEEISYIIEFPDMSTAEANRYAAELRQVLLDTIPNLDVRQRRSDLNTQDFGATLVLVLGAPAAVAVAQGIRVWLEKRRSAKIRIKTPSGEIQAENLTSQDALTVIEAALRPQS